MALVDVDRHILTELVVIQDQMRVAALDYKEAWEQICGVKEQCDLASEHFDKAHPVFTQLSERMGAAIKTCNTKMIFMDDCMSRQKALLNHLVSLVKEADTGKGSESYA